MSRSTATTGGALRGTGFFVPSWLRVRCGLGALRAARAVRWYHRGHGTGWRVLGRGFALSAEREVLVGRRFWTITGAPLWRDWAVGVGLIGVGWAVYSPRDKVAVGLEIVLYCVGGLILWRRWAML